MAYDQKLASVRDLIEKAKAQLAVHPQPHAALVLADGCRIAAALADLVAIITTKNPTEIEAAQALRVREAARQIRAMVPASRQRIARAKIVLRLAGEAAHLAAYRWGRTFPRRTQTLRSSTTRWGGAPRRRPFHHSEQNW